MPHLEDWESQETSHNNRFNHNFDLHNRKLSATMPQSKCLSDQWLTTQELFVLDKGDVQLQVHSGAHIVGEDIHTKFCNQS